VIEGRLASVKWQIHDPLHQLIAVISRAPHHSFDLRSFQVAISSHAFSSLSSLSRIAGSLVFEASARSSSARMRNLAEGSMREVISPMNDHRQNRASR